MTILFLFVTCHKWEIFDVILEITEKPDHFHNQSIVSVPKF